MGLLTTSVGAFPKPVALRRARWQHGEEEIEDDALRRVEDQAVADVLELQKSLGLDTLVDGQMDRGDMVSFFANRIEGLDEGGWVRCFGNRYYRKPIVTDDLVRDKPLTVERWKSAQALADKPVKAVVTGPYTMMDWTFDEHYGSREACCMAFAEVMRQEVEALAAAGAREIQIDEPAISVRPEEIGLVEKAVARVAADLESVERTWLHIAYGDLRPVLSEVMALPVDGLLLELANSRYAMLDDGELPGSKLIGGGVVDVLSLEVETVEQVKKRIERLLASIPAERLWITPDAGLRGLTEEQARGKLEAMVAAAADF